MPAVGKSTVGVLLAKRMGFGFVDTDIIIQTGEGESLSTLIHRLGAEGFCDLEADYIERLELSSHVIATGGSVIYRSRAMRHLEQSGRIVHLDIDLQSLTRRLNDLGGRGVVMAPGQTIEGLFAERTPLYERWAHLSVNCSTLPPDQTVACVISAMAAGTIRTNRPD